MTKDNEFFKWLKKLNESDLRKNVLIPLFKNMGFHDVYEYHGGTELGKDIVMWKKEGISERTNYAVIVKAKKISGKAAGSASAKELCFQIQEAASSTYPDPINGVDQIATRFYVVTSNQIGPEALKAINASLKSQGLDTVTDIIQDMTLLELIKQYLPNIGLMGTLEETHNELRNAVSAERVIIDSTENGTHLHIFLKQNVDETLLTGSIGFGFPGDEKSELAKKAFEDFIKKGKPVEIDSASITSFELPKVINPLVDNNLKLSKVVISPVPTNTSLNLSIKIENHDIYELSSLIFICTNSGTEEITLNNESQNLPLKIKLILNFQKQTLELSYHYELDYSKMDSFQLYKYEKFIYGLSIGGACKLIDNDSGLCLAQALTPAKDIVARNIEWINLLEKLSKIQIKLNKQIFLPEHALSNVEIKTINDTYAVICENKMLLRPGELSMTLSGKKEDLMAKFKNNFGQFKLDSSIEHTIDFFGHTLKFGKPSIIIPAYEFKEEDLTAKENTNDEYILKIHFDENIKAYIEYST